MFNFWDILFDSEIHLYRVNFNPFVQSKFQIYNCLGVVIFLQIHTDGQIGCMLYHCTYH